MNAKYEDRGTVFIIGMGGTIAGTADSRTDLTGYTSGGLGVEELLSSVPGAERYGPFMYEQFCNIESSDIRLDQWQGLLKRVEEILERKDIAGIVITHGTDSLEETAFFLHLTVRSSKPIVVTGAMRPSTAISADGPLNLLHALQTVRAAESVGKGVLVVLNGYIDSARMVQKLDTTHVHTFGSLDFGHLGLVQDDEVFYWQAPLRPHTVHSEFFCSQEELPRVEIVYLYPEVRPEMLRSMVGADTKGLIVAGLGHGTLPESVRTELEILVQEGVVVVRASRVAGGMVTPLTSDRSSGFLAAYGHSPIKARILLALALQTKRSKEELQALFYKY